ncbi:MAG: hypothetical protein RJA26_249 [Actinomycetota bacterium]
MKRIGALRRELATAWSTGQVTSLSRTGPRRFNLGGENSTKAVFVFDKGFVSEPEAGLRRAAGDNSKAKIQSFEWVYSTDVDEHRSRRERRQAEISILPPSVWGRRWTRARAGLLRRCLSWFKSQSKIRRFTIVAILLLLVAFRAMAVGNALSELVSISSSVSDFAKAQQRVPHTNQVSSRAEATGMPVCDLDLTGLQPLDSEKAEDAPHLELIRDIVIGGERQQIISRRCGTDERQFAVRFTLLNSRWEAKSATPMGSHSLLNSVG